MVLLHSKAPEIGRACPDFTLSSVEGKRYSRDDFSSSKALLIAFICNHCPYVRAVEDRLIELKRAFSSSDLEIIGICSNDATRYPDDGQDALLRRWREKDYGFPYLIDETQSVAKDFDAVCTPEFFLFDAKRTLFYHGQLDDNWQDAANVKREFLKEAIVALVENREPPREQKPSMGCSIKWV